MPARPSLLDAVVRLGREFIRRGMTAHANRLRVYHWALRHDLVDSQETLRVEFSPKMLREWERALQMAGNENLPVRPRNAQCACGGGYGFTKLVFGDGHVSACGKCGAEWVSLGDA